MTRISSLIMIFCACFLTLALGQSQNLTDVTGTGTPNVIPVFTSSTAIGDSKLFHFPSISPNGYFNLVGIGTKNPDGTLHINVGAHRNAFDLGEFAAGSFLIRDTVPGSIDIQTFNADLNFQCCTDNGNIFMFPSSGGHLGIGTGSAPNIITVKQNSDTEPIADAWTTYSSARWKTDIQPLESALDKVEHLHGVTFSWKANGKHDIGLIAEEVATVVPEVVGFEKNGKDARSVDYGRLTALLVEAIKQQQAEIRELKTGIEELSRRSSDTPVATTANFGQVAK